MLRIALTGGNGLVGSRIIELLNNDFSFINLPSTRMDITNASSVNTALKNLNFDIFLHLAAYTNVAQAEKEKAKVFRINRNGTANVFSAVKNRGKKFILISTDFVFEGNNPPYFEDAKPNPISVYGSSKYESEKIVNSRAMIVRISYPYRSNFADKKDFFRSFKFFLEKKSALRMITDSLITPTFIDDIAYGLKYLFHNYTAEIFHLVGGSSLSPYAAALLIAEKFNLDKTLIRKTTYSEYLNNKAKIPKLDVIKSKKNNFLKMKSFEQGLDEIKKQLQKF